MTWNFLIYIFSSYTPAIAKIIAVIALDANANTRLMSTGVSEVDGVVVDVGVAVVALAAFGVRHQRIGGEEFARARHIDPRIHVHNPQRIIRLGAVMPRKPTILDVVDRLRAGIPAERLVPCRPTTNYLPTIYSLKKMEIVFSEKPQITHYIF